MKISKPYKFYYCLITGIIFYYFFIGRFYFYKEIPTKSFLYNRYSEDFSLEYTSSSIKKKFLVDVSYRYISTTYPLKEISTGLFSVDLEGKIIGYKPIFSEKKVVLFSPLKSVLNKNFLKSTLFGSIKLIIL